MSRDIRSHAQNKQIWQNIKRVKNLIIPENERAKCTVKYVPIFEYERARIFTDARCHINLVEMRSNARIH